MFKKIIPLILASSIVFSCIAPASAADAPTQGEVVNEIVRSSMAGVIVNLAVTAGTTAIGAYFGQPQVGAFLGPVVADGILDYSDYIAAGFTDLEIYDQFTNYNAQLETDLGTTTLIDGGVRNTFAPTGYGYFYNVSFDETNIQLGASSASGTIVTTDLYSSTSANHRSNASWQIWFDTPIVAPYSGTYTIGCSDSHSFNLTDLLYTPPSVGAVYTVSKGASVRPFSYTYSGNQYHSRAKFSISASSVVVNNFSFSCWVNFFPASGSLPTTQDIAPVSRPTTLITPIAIQNPDETYTVYNNITLVDEGNKVVFDPTTGESIIFTDWAYDYESRTYDLTLDGGGNMTVQFGNDSITMTQGDTVTNIFYVQDPADDPGTDNPDDPDNPGTDADVSGFFAWWKNAWNGFVDRLFTVLDGGDLEVILPGEEGNPEDEADDGWTVFDLFALIRDALWKIITGVISVVLDGFLGLVDAIASLGDFFDIYDLANPDGIFGVPGGGVELWS